MATLAGFKGGFAGLHYRAPTEQEIWDAAYQAGIAAQLAAPAVEPDVSYEIVQDGMVVAGASGSDALREIMRYAIQYQQDGPIEIAKVARTVLYAAPQGEGKSLDPNC